MKKNKIRWQPEHSLAIIYWSVTLAFLFLSLSFVLERASVHWKSLVFIVIFLYLLHRGYHRTILVLKDGLKISYARFWQKKFIPFNDIEEIKINGNHVTILRQEEPFDFTLNKKNIEFFCEMLPEQVKVTIN
ncbi:MAG TPA: EbsA family protein [Tetragenococcus sp.]|nr:EbsA family protein [Tetragenococcus sp.]